VSGRYLAMAPAALGLALWAAPVRAEPIDQLRQFLAQTTSARGEFTQKSQRQAAGASIGGKAGGWELSRGSFEFLRPGKFRWNYSSPYEQLIVSDGEHLFLYDKDLNQVTIKKLAGALPASPASILFGSNDFERDFKVQNDGGTEGIDWIRATPSGKDALFASIRIGFRDGMPVAMQLRDSFGQSTQLAFEHLQRNPTLSSERFHYTPPPGVDVLEEQ